MDGMLRTLTYGDRCRKAENQHLRLRVFECPAMGYAGARAGRPQSGHEGSLAERQILSIERRLPEEKRSWTHVLQSTQCRGFHTVRASSIKAITKIRARRIGRDRTKASWIRASGSAGSIAESLG